MELINYYEYHKEENNFELKQFYGDLFDFEKNYEGYIKKEISKGEFLLISKEDKKVHYWIVNKEEYENLIKDNLRYAFDILLRGKYSRYLIGSLNIELINNEYGFKAIDVETNKVICNNIKNYEKEIIDYLLK